MKRNPTYENTASYYELDNEYIWLIRVLGAALLLASLKTEPSIMLQR